MFSFFKKRQPNLLPVKPLVADMHSHLVPGVDDGSASVEESIRMVRKFYEMGYRKLITTPHIMADFYRNEPLQLQKALSGVQKAITDQGIRIDIEVAAEYYIDEHLTHLLKQKQPLLSFGDRYVLIETSYMNHGRLTEEVVFELQSQGYKPVIAHPERYIYLYGKYDTLVEWHKKGALLQINLLSLIGYYSPKAQKVAMQLIDDGIVSFAGSDCHKLKHLEVLEKVCKMPYYAKLTNLPLLNNSLVS
jgi:tyrosine-protein phosphatase YwqE